MSEANEWTERALRAIEGPASEWDLDPDPIEAGAIEVFAMISELDEESDFEEAWTDNLGEGERQMFRAAFVAGLTVWAEGLGRLLREDVATRDKVRDNLASAAEMTLRAREEGESPLMSEITNMIAFAVTLNEDGSVKDAQMVDAMNLPDEIKAILRGDQK